MYIMEIVYYIKLNIGKVEQNLVRYYYDTDQNSCLQSQ